MSITNQKRLMIEYLLELNEVAVLDMVKARLASGDDPCAILDDSQQALLQVGQRYEKGEYYISSMMMAGEIFREVMEIVEPLLAQERAHHGLGHILLGTVQGDIHDIGKNIFAVMLRSHGFSVTDLGVDVPPDDFVEAALRLKPDILGLSALLTISYGSMKETIQKIKGLEPPIAKIATIIGGGVVDERVCAFVGADYWATDAMLGVQLCNQIMQEKAHP